MKFSILCIFGEKLYLGPISIGKNGFELFFSFLWLRNLSWLGGNCVRKVVDYADTQ